MSDIQVPTQDEIRARYDERSKGDFFGFEAGEYVEYLDYSHVQDMVKDGVTAETWEAPPDNIRQHVLDKMLDYMEFAWDKANDCRGISAGRSVSHYIAWTWLAGDRAFSDQLTKSYAESYRYYGKPQLRLVCEFYGWDWKQWDDDCWRNSEGGQCEQPADDDSEE